MVLKQMTLTFTPLVPIGFSRWLSPLRGHISGTVAERVKVFSFLVFIVVLTGDIQYKDLGRGAADGFSEWGSISRDQQLSIQSVAGPH